MLVKALMVLMSVMIKVIVNQSQEFCEKFAENGFKIDYGFQYQSGSTVGRFLFIKGSYWALQWTESKNELTFNSVNTNHRNDWFANHFRIAFMGTFDSKGTDNHMTGLLYVNNSMNC